MPDDERSASGAEESAPGAEPGASGAAGSASGAAGSASGAAGGASGAAGAEPGAERGRSGVIPAMADEFVAQVRAMTQWLQGLSAAGGQLPAAAESFPLPGALSAAQLTSVADSIIAQRRSIEALQAQLAAFDQQLAVLEQLMGPLAQWSSTWAEFEHRMLPRRPHPEAGNPGPAGS
jgi:hypothetical protein